jgi:ligand-binding sensor domain-containing protein
MKPTISCITFLGISIFFVTVGCNHQPVPISPTTIPLVDATQTIVREIPTTIFEADQQYVILEQTSSTQWVTYDLAQLAQYAFNPIEISLNGDIWVGGGDGVSKFDGEKWTHYSIPAELSDAEYGIRVSAIAITSDNSFWLGASPDLYRFDGYTWRKELDKIGTDVIEVAPDGKIWFSVISHDEGENMPQGVLEFDGKNWTSYTTQDGLISNRVTDIATSTDGTVWLATDEGISSFDGKKWNNYPLEIFCTEPLCDYPPQNNQITIGQDGSIWFAVTKVALFHFVSGNWERYENKLIFQDYFPVENLCQSPNGNLWIGKWSESGVSLSYFDGKQWYVPYILLDDGNPSFPYAQINDIECADDGSIWLASASMGVIHYLP